MRKLSKEASARIVMTNVVIDLIMESEEPEKTVSLIEALPHGKDRADMMAAVKFAEGLGKFD